MKVFILDFKNPIPLRPMIHLLKDPFGRFASGLDEGLHFHDKQMGLFASVQYIPDGNHLFFVQVVERIVLRLIARKAQGIEQRSMKIVRQFDLVLGPHPPFQQALLVLEVAFLERTDPLIEALMIRLGIARLGEHFTREVFVKIIGSEIVADVFQKA